MLCVSGLMSLVCMLFMTGPRTEPYYGIDGLVGPVPHHSASFVLKFDTRVYVPESTDNNILVMSRPSAEPVAMHIAWR